MIFKLRHIVTALALVSAAPASALVPPAPPCHGVTESGMTVRNLVWFGHYKSGVVVEEYAYGGGAGAAQLPAKLKGFDGVRVVHCGTGRFVTINTYSGSDVDMTLSATEFLRRSVQNEEKLSFNAVLRASKAVYRGKVMQFRETKETCGCYEYFPGLRPKSLAPYGGE